MKPLSPIIILSFVIMTLACSKPANTNNTNTSAVYTDTSTNYLRFTVNGNNWHNTPNDFSARWINGRTTLYLAAFNNSYGSEKEMIYFNLISGDTLRSGTYGFNSSNNLAQYCNIFSGTKDSVIYTPDSTHIGAMYINFDLNAGRVYGFFSFYGKSTKTSAVTYMGSGAFSMPYTTN